MSMTALERAIDKATSQTKFAEAIGTTQQLVSYHMSKRNRMPAEWVIPTERAFGIPRHELRPDLYPAAQADAA